MSPHCDNLDGTEDNTLIFALDTRAYYDTPYICSQKDKLFRRYLDKHPDRRTSGPLTYYTFLEDVRAEQISSNYKPEPSVIKVIQKCNALVPMANSRGRQAGDSRKFGEPRFSSQYNHKHQKWQKPHIDVKFIAYKSKYKR